MMTKIQAIELSAEKFTGNIRAKQLWIQNIHSKIIRHRAEIHRQRKKWSSLYVMVLLTGIVGRS